MRCHVSRDLVESLLAELDIADDRLLGEIDDADPETMSSNLYFHLSQASQHVSNALSHVKMLRYYVNEEVQA